MGLYATSLKPMTDITLIHGLSSSQTPRLLSNACVSNLMALLRIWLATSIIAAYLSTPAYFFGRPDCQDTYAYRPLSLGWRPKEHTPTTEDYGKYQETLDRLFSRPYARAALLEGAIVWCIALLCLGDSVLDVTMGPSSDALSLGRCWELVGSSVLYDDRLNEAEIDVICGVYEIATGE